MGGGGKGGGDLLAVAVMEIEPDIARHIVIKEGRARCCRGPGAVTAGKGSISTTTASAASLAAATRLGDDGGHRLADMPHLVGGEHIADRGSASACRRGCS